jgi:CHAD domain-containing protein
MPRVPDRSKTRSELTVPPVYLLREATLALLDGAIETLTWRTDDGAVHAVRRDCKRIRAALRLLRACLGRRVYRRENRRVRDSARPLTGVRDAFVLRRTLRTLPQRSMVLQRNLNSEYDRERRALERRGVQAALEQLNATRKWLAGIPALDSETVSAVAGARNIYKVGRKALAKARHRDDHALHEWRKQAKYLLYQLELLKTVFDAKFGKLGRHASQLAEALGDDHDLAMLVGKLRRYEARDPSLEKYIKKRRRKLQARAFRLGNRLYRHSAKHIEATLAARLSKSK